jgi:Kef-type K+ transport system membrane component KefB
MVSHVLHENVMMTPLVDKLDIRRIIPPREMIVLDAYLLLLHLSLVLFIGFLFGKLAERFNIPDITGYILAGLLIGPNALGLVGHEAQEGLAVISNIVLGIIAYQIGTELWIPKLKKSGRSIVIITFVQAVLTALVTFAGIHLLFGQLWLSLSLSAIAVATAPAPIMTIVRKLRAKGPLTDHIVSIVGLDDIVGVIIFGLLSSLAVGSLSGEAVRLSVAMWDAVVEVVASIGVGLALGLVLGVTSRWFVQKLHKRDRYIAHLALIMSMIMSSVWIAHNYHLSTILIPITIGMTFTNFIGKETFDIQTAALNNFGGPFIILFFTIAGLELSVGVLGEAGIIAIVYIVLRIFGKMGGAYAGSVITRSPSVIKKHLGVSLLPQAGVSIGMLIALSTQLPKEETALLQAVVLSAILFFELTGPYIFKRALEKAGESRIDLPEGTRSPGVEVNPNAVA